MRICAAQDDHDVQGHHLTEFLRWTACEHLPDVLLRQDPRTGSSDIVRWRGWGSSHLLSCSERVPSDWIVGFFQVRACTVLAAMPSHSDCHRINNLSLIYGVAAVRAGRNCEWRRGL